jgi:hypothetical protein
VTYRVFLGLVLITWPLVITGLLFFMSKLENYVNRLDADTPEDAGVEPVAGSTRDREVKILFGDRVVGEPD